MIGAASHAAWRIESICNKAQPPVTSAKGLGYKSFVRALNINSMTE